MKPVGKVAVITGASSGIGAEIARQFAEYGYHLYLLARREERLKTIADQLRQSHIKIYYSKCDVSDVQQVQVAFATIAKTFGNIDFLINNAGLSSDVNIQEARPDAFMSDLSVNVIGTYLCTMAAYPLMINGGAIVNISSIRARTGTPTSSIGYAAAKAGVINLTQSFAKQLGLYKIRVNCIAPGAIYPTEMTTDWTEAILQEKIAETPLGRLGTPADIANVALFLISDSSSFITGHTIDVNGGRWMN
jgi:3-oxoacyl-[acyl-carrier protein] reductase